MTTKICTKCGEPKDLEEFGKLKISPDGKAYWCKACAKQHANIYKAHMTALHTEKWYKSDQAPKILKCAKCKRKFAATEFSRNRELKSGYGAYCQKCVRKYQNAMPKEYKYWRSVAIRAERVGMDLNIDKKGFMELNKDVCMYCGQTADDYKTLRKRVLKNKKLYRIHKRFKMNSMKIIIRDGELISCCGYCKHMRNGRSHEAWAAVAKVEVAKLRAVTQ